MDRAFNYSVGAMLLLMFLFAACSSSPDGMEAKCEQAALEAQLLEMFGEITLDKAVTWGLVAPVEAEVDRLGTADFLMDEKGWGQRDTVLYLACSSGSDLVVEMLLSRGADPTLRSSGELPINVAWSCIYSDRALEKVASGKMDADIIGKYKRILSMLAIPDMQFEPRSLEAEAAVTQEIFENHLSVSEDKDGNYLKVNGSDIASSTLESLRNEGFIVYPASMSPAKGDLQEVCLDLRWISDYEAEVGLFVPVSFSWQGTVTYAYGHWMLDINSGVTSY